MEVKFWKSFVAPFWMSLCTVSASTVYERWALEDKKSTCELQVKEIQRWTMTRCILYVFHVESSKLHVKKKVDMRVRKKYRQGQSADLTDPANTPTSVKLQAY